MVNTLKIKGKMAEQNVSVGQVADELGIARNTASGKLNGKIAISLDDAEALSKLLNLTSKDRDNIFFSSLSNGNGQEEE